VVDFVLRDLIGVGATYGEDGVDFMFCTLLSIKNQKSLFRRVGHEDLEGRFLILGFPS
jgi:hypothetical protein